MRWVKYDYEEVPFSMDKYSIHGSAIFMGTMQHIPSHWNAWNLVNNNTTIERMVLVRSCIMFLRRRSLVTTILHILYNHGRIVGNAWPLPQVRNFSHMIEVQHPSPSSNNFHWQEIYCIIVFENPDRHRDRLAHPTTFPWALRLMGLSLKICGSAPVRTQSTALWIPTKQTIRDHSWLENLPSVACSHWTITYQVPRLLCALIDRRTGCVPLFFYDRPRLLQWYCRARRHWDLCRFDWTDDQFPLILEIIKTGGLSSLFWPTIRAPW